MNQKADADTRVAVAKPRLALLLATGFGLGYLPKAPGTWGSLGGLVVTVALWRFSLVDPSNLELGVRPETSFFINGSIVGFALAVVGIWAAGRAEEHLAVKDPNTVIIDEISGQQLSFLTGLGWSAAPNWKYLLLGFILFRVFDIWKPFPVRRAEAWPGGWGIMADDWLAAMYAALGLWLARALGL